MRGGEEIRQSVIGKARRRGKREEEGEEERVKKGEEGG